VSEGQGTPFMSPRRRGRGAPGPAQGGAEAPAKEPGARWEYRWQMAPLVPVPEAPNLLIDALNPLGAEGWDVCGFAMVASEDSSVGWVLMKRPVPWP
jgi:hypothetical protein